MQNPIIITSEQAERTDEYLRTLAKEKDTITVHLQSLFGRCCLATTESMFVSEQIDLNRLNQDLSAFVDVINNNSQSHNLALDPLLVLEADLMLRNARTVNPVFSKITDRIAEELSQQPSKILSTGRVRLMAAHLQRLNYSVKAATPDKLSTELLRSSSVWISASQQDLVGLTENLLANGTPLNPTQSEILSLIALAELRNYHVDVACKLLRLVLQHGQISSITREAVNYVALQRRRNGAYGFVSPFLEQHDTRHSDLDLALYLPMTLNATWIFHVAMRNTAENNSAPVAA
jgi:hypothetical protein